MVMWFEKISAVVTFVSWVAPALKLYYQKEKWHPSSCPSFIERKCVFKVFDSTKVVEDLLVNTSLFNLVIHYEKKMYL